METVKIKIPDHLKHLPIFRGFPVPFNVLCDKNGIPNFKINDEKRVEKCIEKKLCHVCGNKLRARDMWMIGGEQSAFHPRGAFNDPPVHKACGIFSLTVCPYLANTRYHAAYQPGINIIKLNESETITAMNPTQSMERLQFFVFARVSGFTVTRPTPLHRFIHGNKPYIDIEYYKDGRQVSPDDIKEFRTLP